VDAGNTQSLVVVYGSVLAVLALVGAEVVGVPADAE